VSDLWGAGPTAGATWSGQLASALTRADIARYAGASGDVNLIHVDEPLATAAGHPAVVAHGMLTMGLTGSFLTGLVGHDQVRRFGGRFLATVAAGDSLDCTVRVHAVRALEDDVELELELKTTKGDGTVVFQGAAVAVQTIRKAL
jgi:peroxisomal enoyl-CoA hydratase 2